MLIRRQNTDSQHFQGTVGIFEMNKSDKQVKLGDAAKPTSPKAEAEKPKKSGGVTYRLLYVGLMVVLFGSLGVMLLINRSDVRNSGDAGQKVNPVVLENQQPGTNAWKSPNFNSYFTRPSLVEDAKRLEELRRANGGQLPTSDRGGVPQQGGWTDNAQIEGYTNKTSVNLGETITFHIRSRLPTYNMTIYRMGWYDGNGGRWMHEVQNLPGVLHPLPTPDPVTGLVEANWPAAYSLNIPTTWTSGVYMVWIGSGSTVKYMVFVVRDDSRRADIMFTIATTTYQAYNEWGGKSLYEYNSPGGRAYKVSYNRPYAHNDGAGLYMSGDYFMVQWLEKEGYDVAYSTNEDFHANPNLLNNNKVFLSNFHDEYWSWQMFDNAMAARDRGVDQAWFTSNNVYWQIRYENGFDGTPRRTVVCYKDQALDPMATSATPNLTTVLFRDAIVNRPENQLLGVMFDNLVGYGDYVPFIVTNTNHWIYAGTGLQDGQVLDNKMAGYEFDRVFNNGHTPADLQVLSHSPATIVEGVTTHANTTIYTAPSGAMVFAAGINYWPYYLLGNWIWPQDARVNTMTRNILNTMIGAAPPPAATLTPTNTLSGPTNTPTKTLTPSLTFTPSKTHTPSPTHTPTITSTPTTTPVPGSSTFYRAINLNGPALTIDGNAWDAGTATGFTTNGWGQCDQTVTLVPAVSDPNLATMLRCGLQRSPDLTAALTVPNGTYDVYVYVWENDWPETFSIYVENTLKLSNYNSGGAGIWNKFGPWRFEITDGAIDLRGTGGYISNISGLEVWKFNPLTSNTATFTPSATHTATATATRTATNTATATSTATGTTVNTATHTATATSTATGTEINTATATHTATATSTATYTLTPTEQVATPTFAFTFEVPTTNTPIPTATSTATPTSTATATATGTATAINTPTHTATATATSTATNTATATSTVAASATRTSTATRTPTATRTSTLTRTPTATRTNTSTPLPTRTNTATPLPTSTLSGTPAFYRAINFNGPALTIDGKAFEAGTAPGFTTNGWGICDQSVTLIPAVTDTNLATMLRCAIYRNGLTASLTVPNGMYDVYIYVWENDWPQTYSVSLEGTARLTNYNSVGAGRWAKFGPWRATITAGTVSLTSTGWFSNLSGMEVWRVTP
jgi:hypothetical protein